MKSLYLPGQVLALGQQLEIQDEDYHHLVVVSRLSKSESILLLNGSGEGFLSKVVEITKKQLLLELIEKKISTFRPNITAMIFTPKKDSLDLMIKSCVELGVKEILLVRGDRSVEKVPEAQKLLKIVKQAIEQSNSYHEHIVRPVQLKDFNFSVYDTVNILDLLAPSPSSTLRSSVNPIILVGPEGGFSESERMFFQTIPQAQYIVLQTNILRAPTALCAGLGWLYAKKSVI